MTTSGACTPENKLFSLIVSSVMAALAALVSTLFSPGLPAHSQQQGSALRIEVELAGKMLVEGEETPVKVDAAVPTPLRIRAENRGADPAEVTGLRFEGKVIGVPVFRCDVVSPLLVSPGEAVETSFEIEAACLKDQATGLVPAVVTVYGSGRVPLARWTVALDIAGSLKSVYGLTGVFVVALTGFALASLLAALIRQRLPRNRFSRALRFTTVGIGLGFSLVFVLASAAVLIPDAENWVPLVSIPTIVLTIGGFLSPTPSRSDAPEASTSQATQAMTELTPTSAPTARLEGAGWAGAGSWATQQPQQGVPTGAGITPGESGRQDETPRPSIPTRKVRPVSSDEVDPGTSPRPPQQ